MLTMDPSMLLPQPISVSLSMPEDLKGVVEEAFDKAFRHKLDEMRNKLLNTVQDLVEQQLAKALTKYSRQVSGCENAVIAARRTILEESNAVNDKYRRVQDLVAQHARENSRVQEALAKIEKDRAQVKTQQHKLEQEKQSIKTDRARLHTEQGKLQSSLVEIRDERKQILHWQQLLSQTEQTLAEREAQEKVQTEKARSKSPMMGFAPSAVASLELAKKTVQQKSPIIEKYEQVRRGTHAPTPIKMLGGSHDTLHRSASDSIESRPAWN